MIASIIVPTYNRACSLKKAFECFVNQDFDVNEYEIIIVNNGSTDNTAEITSHFQSKYPNINIKNIYDNIPGLLTGRHRGVSESSSDILIFVDDDIQVDKKWLSNIVDSFNDKKVHIVGGKYLPNYECKPPWWLKYFWYNTPYGGKMCNSLSLLDLGDELLEIDPVWIWGLCFAIRKETLIAVNGFHPDTVPKKTQYLQGDGETGLSKKLKKNGFKAIYNPNVIVYHEVSKERMTINYFKQRYYFSGVAQSYYDIRNGNRDLFKINSQNINTGLKNIVKTFYNKFILIYKNGFIKYKVNKLNQSFIAARNEGYQYHNNMVLKNKDLLEWVLKKDYWDYKLPNT